MRCKDAAGTNPSTLAGQGCSAACQPASLCETPRKKQCSSRGGLCAPLWCVDAAGITRLSIQEQALALREMHTQVGMAGRCTNTGSPLPFGRGAGRQQEQASQRSLAGFRFRSPHAKRQQERGRVRNIETGRWQRIAQLLESEREEERVASRGIRPLGTGRHATVDRRGVPKNSSPSHEVVHKHSDTTCM